MTPAELERRFLDFVYTTDATITPGALAYYARCTLKDAENLLDTLARQGTIRIEHDDQGLIFYIFPGRTKLSPAAAASEEAPRGRVPLQYIGGGLNVPVAVPMPQVQVQTHRPLLPAVAASGDAALALPAGQVACPYCGETILAVAKKCKHCGEMIDAFLRQALVPVHVNVGIQNLPQAGKLVVGPRVRPGTAATLALWPGAGHMYSGRIGTGVGWMFAIIVGYACFFVPGFALHITSLFSAAKIAREENAKNGHDV